MTKPKLEFTTQTFSSFSDCTLDQSDLLFFGEDVDDRGAEAIDRLRHLADSSFKLGFKPETNELVIDGGVQPLSALAEICRGKNKIRIESTTLGLGEILKAVQAAKHVGIGQLEFVYIEPKEYTNFPSGAGDYLNPRDFELTDNRVYRSVHGFAYQRGTNTKENYLFFLGYESSRLLQAFEQSASKIEEKCAVIGIPPFVPGWETNALASSAADLKSLGFSANAILYCAANSVREAYLLLWEHFARVRHEAHTFIVSPIGTKPHSLATILFLIETKGGPYATALYYDHPVRRKGRSRELGKWHLYRVAGI